LFASNAARPAGVNGASRLPASALLRVPLGVFANDSSGELRSQWPDKSRGSKRGCGAAGSAAASASTSATHTRMARQNESGSERPLISIVTI
jgi:hypothetical protein